MRTSADMEGAEGSRTAQSIGDGEASAAAEQASMRARLLALPQSIHLNSLQEDEQTTRSAGRHGSGRRTSWGFVVNLPATSELQAYATARAAAAAATATRQSVHLRLSQPTSADLNTVGGAGSSAVIPKITRQSQEAVPAGGHGAPQQPAGARSAEARSSPSAKTKLPQGGSEVHASSPATATGSPRGASTRSHHEQVTHLLSEGGVSLETVPVQGKVLSQTRLPSVMDEGGSAAVGRPPLLAAFEGSRLFHCPDAVQAMADAHDAGPLLHGLQGSFITPTQDAATAAALVELRTGLRTVLRAAWSREAVRRGIGLARQGSHAEALECYDQALDLDRRNVDAHVARGAALANQKHWRAALACFTTALELEPGDENAARYLATVQQRMPPHLRDGADASRAAPSTNASTAGRWQQTSSGERPAAELSRPHTSAVGKSTGPADLASRGFAAMSGSSGQVAPGDGGKPPWAEEVDVHSHPSAAPPVAAPHAPPRAPAPGRGSLGGGAIGDDAATEEVPNMDLDRALALVLQARSKGKGDSKKSRKSKHKKRDEKSGKKRRHSRPTST